MQTEDLSAALLDLERTPLSVVNVTFRTPICGIALVPKGINP